MKKSKIGGSVWLTVLMFGFFGQVAWIVENMYFNVFMDRTVTTNPFAVSTMVAASAIVATFSTILAGTWSDKLGRRRKLMSLGYIIWGIIIISFCLIKVDYATSLLGISEASAITLCVVAIVIMDCVMTFFGSAANDAAFNAWITDNVHTENRGKIEGVIAVMPILAMAAVFGGLDGITQDTYITATGEYVKGWAADRTFVHNGNWTLFYCLLGGIIVLVGIIGLIVLRDSIALKPNPKSDFKDMFYGFKKSVVIKNKNLYFALLAMMVTGIANNSYMSYLIMYAERTLGYEAGSYIIPVAVIIVTAAVASVLFGIFMDKFDDRRKFFIPLIITYVVGALAMMLASPIGFPNYIKTPLWAVCLAGFVLMSANLCLSAALTATVRDLTPPDNVGRFQGVRMFFWVLVPMVIGPMLTAIINSFSQGSGKFDQYGNEITIYSAYMFLVAAIIGSLAVLPVLKLNNATLSDMKPFANDEQNVAELGADSSDNLQA